MKTENIEKSILLFNRFKRSKEYNNRTIQLQFASIAKEIISETLKFDKLTNEHLTGLIQMFKVNASTSTFEKYLKLNVSDAEVRNRILENKTSLEIGGYTAAGRFMIKNLSDVQLDQIKTFLKQAFDVKSIEDAVKLSQDFEKLNIPVLKNGIYSPWLYYINPSFFPIVNSITKLFIKWMEMSKTYYSLISQFSTIKKHFNIDDLGIIDGFIYALNETLKKKDDVLVKLFSMSLSDEKLIQIYNTIKDKDGKYSDFIKKEYYFRNNIDEKSNVKRFWLVGAFTSHEELGLNGTKDRTDYYINNSVWINGYKNKYKDLVNSVKVGDEVAIKAVFVKEGKSTMRIKSTGVVNESSKDGRSLKVEWLNNFNQFDVEFTGGHWSTISEVGNEDHIKKIWI